MDSPYSHHHHHHHHRNHHNSHPPPPPPNSATVESQFRILCPVGKAGGVIGKGGTVIRHLREVTGARIRIIDDFGSSHSDERVILISSPNNPNTRNGEDDDREIDRNCNYSAVQGALLKVFERILKVDEERGEIDSNNSSNYGNGNDGNGNGNGNHSNVVCRMLVGSDQVENVLWRGGKVLDKIRQDSCAQVRVLSWDNLPPCASPADEVVQISGNFQAVKKALLLISSCLQEETCQVANITSQSDTYSHRGSHAADHHSQGYLAASDSENFGPNRMMIPEEDVVFKLLCPVEKTGILIGKGGFVVRGIENETGASIKINESVITEFDERLVVISARESADLRHSPAQDAVMRVHTRMAEIGFEPGAAVVARLLVPSQQIGCVIGKGGYIVNEMRRSTGANIRIFGRDQGPKIKSLNYEVVQVMGNIQCVQDAVFQITSRIREHLFPPRQHHFQELLSPSFRPRHDQVSPGHYHEPIVLNHGYDNRSFSQGPTHPSSFSHGTERIDGVNIEQDHHHYSGDRTPLPPLPPYAQPSPNSWYPQAVNNGHPGRFSDAGPGISGAATSNSQSAQMQTTTTVEMVVPQTLLPHVCGENRINLGHLTQFSGAEVFVYDPQPGATEGRVVLSGTPVQLHTAQSLVHAFILCGQSF